MCVKACPGHCLTVTKGDEKTPVVWISDFSYCCLCGACVETCPTGALEFSHKVYLVVKDRKELAMDLLADLKSRAAKAAESAAANAEAGSGSSQSQSPATPATPAAANAAATANETA
jgi:formate hydrogenlyase subunit 6/NADH:ubiquinone oxidoreductase subunit I